MGILAELTGTDVLADVIGSLHLEGRVFCRMELSGPWGFRTPDDGLARFHVIERGACWMRAGEEDPVPLSAGDLVVALNAHQLSDGPRTRTVSMKDFLRGFADKPGAVLRHRGRGLPTHMVCGSFRFSHGEGHPLLAVLPPLLHVKGQDGQALEWLDLTLRFLASEARHPRPGSETVITRLTEVIFVQAVRAWIEMQPEGRGGWLGALRDRQISRVLSLMHGEPGRIWTVPALAAKAGMSRATLARRFAVLVGEPPLTYLSRWRMRTAAMLLRSQSLSLSEVAERVGYQSEAALGRAFRRMMGVAPGVYRRAATPEGRPRASRREQTGVA
jgi:AraC-like DNA-binding protein